MDEKVKAVKKSAEAPQPPLKFAKLPLLPSVGALGHAEFRSFRFLGLRDTDFFKAGGLWIREVRRSSSLSAQLYTVGPTAIASTQGGLSLPLPPRVRAPPTDGLGRFGPSAPLHDGARPMGLRSASPCLHLGVSIWCSAGPLSRLGVEEAGRSCGPEAVDVLAPHRVRLDPNVERAVAGGADAFSPASWRAGPVPPAGVHREPRSHQGDGEQRVGTREIRGDPRVRISPTYDVKNSRHAGHHFSLA